MISNLSQTKADSLMLRKNYDAVHIHGIPKFVLPLSIFFERNLAQKHRHMYYLSMIIYVANFIFFQIQHFIYS